MGVGNEVRSKQLERHALLQTDRTRIPYPPYLVSDELAYGARSPHHAHTNTTCQTFAPCAFQLTTTSVTPFPLCFLFTNAHTPAGSLDW